MRKVVLVFPPTTDDGAGEQGESLVELKREAYRLMTAYLKKKEPSLPVLQKVFPIDRYPISLGLLSLSTYLKNNGVNVDYVHGDYWLKGKQMSWNSFVNFIVEKCDGSSICGIYSTTPSAPAAAEIAKAVKSANDNTIVVFGGPHVTFADTATMERYPFIDFVVRGEGEHTLLDIVTKADSTPERSFEVVGTTYRLNGAVKRAPEREIMKEQDIPSIDYGLLPADFDLLLIDMYSRGCPFACNFCVESKMWNRLVRYRDPSVVAKELSLIKNRYGQDLIHIADSEIDINLRRLLRLLDCIEAADSGIRYTVNIRPDAHKRISLEMFERMNSMGFVGYFIGVESGSDKVMRLMNRQATYSDFLKTLALLNKSGAKMVVPYLMLGFPGETEETLGETHDKFIGLLAEDRITFLFPKVFVPYPGTDVYENPERYSIKISKDFDHLDRFSFEQPFISPILSNETLRSELIRFYDDIVKVYKSKLS